MAFVALISLDIFSHWLQMYSSLVAGDLSHKVPPADLLRASQISLIYEFCHLIKFISPLAPTLLASDSKGY